MRLRLPLAAAMLGLAALSPSGCETASSIDSTGDATAPPAHQHPGDVMARAKAFLDDYLPEYEKLYVEYTTAEWTAETTGEKEAFDAKARCDLAMREFHSDPQSFRTIRDLLAAGDRLDPLVRRSLQVAELEFLENQLPKDILQDLAGRAAKTAEISATFRAQLDGASRSNNELLDMLSKERSTPRRRQIWEALKQVGGAVAADLIELAKVRNRAAAQLGFANYWELKIRLQEHDPELLLKTFEELARLTDGPFRDMKRELDAELARKFGIDAADLMPWHYDNPFFQAPPPAEEIDLDEFYRDRKKEEIVEIAMRFYGDIGLPIEDIVARSDLYEREGKSQHAFCTDMNRRGDVRTLQNVRPTAEWMDTMLHEMGHAIYDRGVDPSLPFNLRSANHIFTTEAVAMLFGALAKNPSWLIAFAEADAGRVRQVEEAILRQRRREQLIFCRWALVMLHFEKKLYEDPDRDLSTLWWDTVERFQLLRRPEGRSEPDWASKPHFTIAPVYYHNYMLGELFAAQLRACLARIAGHEGPAARLSFNDRKEFGEFLAQKVFRPGQKAPWSEFVREVTGEELTARHFARELE